MYVRKFVGRKIDGESMTIPDLSVSLRHSLETMTIEPAIGSEQAEYNGDIEDNDEYPEFEDDLTDLDTLKSFVKGKQSNILNNLHYEQQQSEQQNEADSLSRTDKESGDNPT